MKSFRLPLSPLRYLSGTVSDYRSLLRWFSSTHYSAHINIHMPFTCRCMRIVYFRYQAVYSDPSYLIGGFVMTNILVRDVFKLEKGREKKKIECECDLMLILKCEVVSPQRVRSFFNMKKNLLTLKKQLIVKLKWNLLANLSEKSFSAKRKSFETRKIWFHSNRCRVPSPKSNNKLQ